MGCQNCLSMSSWYTSELLHWSSFKGITLSCTSTGYEQFLLGFKLQKRWTFFSILQCFCESLGLCLSSTISCLDIVEMGLSVLNLVLANEDRAGVRDIHSLSGRGELNSLISFNLSMVSLLPPEPVLLSFCLFNKLIQWHYGWVFSSPMDFQQKSISCLMSDIDL